MKQLRIIGITISTLFVAAICNAQVSFFKPDWQIGDTWRVEFAERDYSQFYAAMEFIGGPKFGNFGSLSSYLFEVTDTKAINGKECFEVDLFEQYSDRDVLIMRLYYTVDTLKIRLVEKIIDNGGILPDNVPEGEGPIVEPYSTTYLPLSWPDFMQLDPAHSPQVFGSILQETTVGGDILTVNWRLGYNAQDGTYYSTWQQIWKKGEPWWSEMKTVAADGQVITKAKTFFVEAPPTKTFDVAVSPDMLWPPNHDMVEIISTIVGEDMQSPHVNFKIDSVESNEPDDAPGAGDGHTTGDFEITADGKLFLRAERDGKGSGRIYTITYTATDGSGNQGTASASVAVPHDQAPK